MSYHDDVWELTDRGLMRACVLVSRHRLFDVLQLSNWERKFLAECPNKFASFGSISWKQRKTAREVLTKIINELERRKELGEWIKEAKAVENPLAQAAESEVASEPPPAPGGSPRD